MIEKDLHTFGVLTYAWVIALSSWGGAVSYWRKVTSQQIDKFQITVLMGELMTSGFAGVLTFWLAHAAGFNELIIAALVGISGHMGARAVTYLEHVLQAKFSNGQQ
jgi:hypothetical protein